MKIAMIVPYPIFPPDEGGRARAYNLLKQLSREHETVLMTPRSAENALNDLPATLYETTPPGRRNQILSPGFFRRGAAVMRKERPGVLLCEYPWPGIHAAYLARRFGARLVLDAPNVEGDRFRSTGSALWRGVDFYERFIARRAHHVLCVSEEDRARFIARGIPAAKITVVPNGFDPDVLHPDAAAREETRRALGIDAATRMLLFFGQLDYAPNREALKIIAADLLPLLDASGAAYELVVAGKSANIDELRACFRHPHLRFTGAVPQIAPYINAADAVLSPIRSGGGTRLKILESVACGTPVVSTTEGAEGIDRAACGDLLAIEDGWPAFVARLLGPNAVKRGNVPAAFIDMYSWANIVRRVDWAAL